MPVPVPVPARDAKPVPEDRKADPTDQIDKLAVLPENPPVDLNIACDRFVAAYLAYATKANLDPPNPDIVRARCRQRSVKMAACHAYALERMPVELSDHVSAVLKRCGEKFP